MVQAADRFSFTLKAFPTLGIIREVFGKDFDRNGAVEASVGGGIHFAHATRTDLTADPVRTEFRACCQGHILGASSLPLLNLKKLEKVYRTSGLEAMV